MSSRLFSARQHRSICWRDYQLPTEIVSHHVRGPVRMREMPRRLNPSYPSIQVGPTYWQRCLNSWVSGAERSFTTVRAWVVRHLWHERPNWVFLIHHTTSCRDKPGVIASFGLQRPLMRLPIQADVYNPDGRSTQVQDRGIILAAGKATLLHLGRPHYLSTLPASKELLQAHSDEQSLNLSLLTPGLRN